MLLLVFMALSWGLGAGPARAAVTPGVTVSVSPTSIHADGTSMATVTATVGDSGGNPVVGDSITFSSDGTNTFGAATGTTDANGLYSTTITSTTTPGTVTITAADATLSGTAKLIQTGPATTVTVAASPNPIVADGKSTSTATATVTDANGNPVSGDPVAFSSNDPSDQVSATTPGPSPGTYTATITSSTAAGLVTITAVDSSVTPNVSGSGFLTQTSGTAGGVAVSLTPPTLVANGSSSGVAIATVLDAHGNPVVDDFVTFTSTDPGVHFASASGFTGASGSYSTTVTSSTTVGSAAITATDSSASPKLNGAAILTQTPGAATSVSVTLSPSAIPADGNATSTATARVTDALGHPVPGETIVFSSSDPGERFGRVVDNGDGTYATTVTSSTTPGSATITAADLNAAGLSARAIVNETKPTTATTTALAVSNATPNAGSKVTYTATVTGQTGSRVPSGSVVFLDGTKAIGACASQPLTSAGGSATATCRVSYASSGVHEISAHYLGDPNFAGSTSGVAEVSVHKSSNPPPTRMLVTMQWEFHFTPNYTTILQFFVNGVPKGANVMVSCKGHGCPYARHTLALIKRTVCKTTKKTRKCAVQQPPSTVRLQSGFGNRRLGVGARVTVDITKAGFIGKHYVFTVVARKAPRVSIGCLTPGANKPESCPS